MSMRDTTVAMFAHTVVKYCDTLDPPLIINDYHARARLLSDLCRSTMMLHRTLSALRLARSAHVVIEGLTE